LFTIAPDREVWPELVDAVWVDEDDDVTGLELLLEVELVTVAGDGPPQFGVANPMRLFALSKRTYWDWMKISPRIVPSAGSPPLIP